jgi:cell division protein FtsB
VELRMNRPSYDEYEEVESPFAARSQEKSTSRDRLRTRKNVFNRPFATESTSAPLILETKSTRKSIGSPDDEEMLEHRQSDLSGTDIEYLDEDEDDEEVVVEKKPVVRSSVKKVAKPKKNLLQKFAWSVVGLLILRLIFMDRGVWDYFATEGEIKEKQNELKSIQTENKSLKAEIARVQIDKNFQRQLAKESLGVIAADEFLILFAGESAESDEIKPTEL